MLIGVALVAVNALVLWSCCRSWDRYGHPGFGGYRLDLDVYRIGSTAWRHGSSLYGPLPATARGFDLPFTYPPAAAILFAPLSLAPFAVASLSITVATVVGLAVVLALAVRSLGLSIDWMLLGALFPLALVTEPVRQTLGYGQVNVLLMVLVAVDCLTTTRWPRGVLVGLAAAVKLTPAAFILFFLIRGDRWSALRSIGGFAVPTVLAFAVDPHDSVLYWTKLVGDSGRIGPVGYAGNQSLLAVLARFEVPPAASNLVWGLLVVATLVTAAIGMRRASRNGELVLALGLNAVAELLCSPISWSHHWVWVVPLFVGLGGLGWRTRRWLAIVLTLAGLLLVWLGPQWWFTFAGGRELTWSLWQKFVGSAYVYYGIAVLLSAAIMRYRAPTVVRGSACLSSSLS
ncbi:MAG TPA: glycosyltransferase 87 family protein [Pseudonocardiaceae bacterium]|nr:glycosyltransferase 87 family protein [Pseudonocardiaceae bacterium]